MCIMVMLKAKDTSNFQRHTVWVVITFTREYSTRMYQNIHYWMNVMLQHIKNTISPLSACCCLFCFHFIEVLLQKKTTKKQTRFKVHLPGLQINQLSKHFWFFIRPLLLFSHLFRSQKLRGYISHWHCSD